MIEVFYITIDESFGMLITGHAGAGEKGQDLVCAAASALAQALSTRAETVPAYHAKIRRNTESASVSVVCTPGKKAREGCREMFETILTGFELLAESFQENVRVDRVDKEGSST